MKPTGRTLATTRREMLHTPSTPPATPRRRPARRSLIAACFLAAALLLPATTAFGESEWCDDGSPPPNDYRLQQTGTSSQISAYNWLMSISGGEYLLSLW